MEKFFQFLTLIQSSILVTIIPFVVKFFKEKLTERRDFKRRELELTTIGIPCDFDFSKLPVAIPIVNDWKASHYVEGKICLVRYKRISFALKHCDYVYYVNGVDEKFIDLDTMIKIVTGNM